MTNPRIAALPVAVSQADAANRGQLILSRYVQGDLSAEMALMYWLQACPRFDQIEKALNAALREATLGGPAHRIKALSALAALVAANAPGCVRIAEMLRSGVDTEKPAESIDQGIAFAKQLFDWSVTQSAESSVALYTFGNPAILAAATAEIVSLMQRWGLLSPARDVLDIGCGIGRFAQALSPEVNTLAAIDVSPRMIEAAQRRCAGFKNVRVLECTGYDLGMFPPDSFDLVYSVDCFPYLFQAGMPLVETHFGEVLRVLKPGGDFLIFEFSYHRDLEEDCRDVGILAQRGFDVVVSGARPLKIWDGAAFHLRRR